MIRISPYFRAWSVKVRKGPYFRNVFVCIFVFQMGKCKFTPALKAKYTWAVAVPGNEHACKCKICNRVINVEKGTQSLEQHAKNKVSCFFVGSFHFL